MYIECFCLDCNVKDKDNINNNVNQVTCFKGDNDKDKINDNVNVNGNVKDNVIDNDKKNIIDNVIINEFNPKPVTDVNVKDNVKDNVNNDVDDEFIYVRSEQNLPKVKAKKSS